LSVISTSGRNLLLEQVCNLNAIKLRITYLLTQRRSV
jgi:hypothetical protein